MATARLIKDDAFARKDRYRRADETRTHLHQQFRTLGSQIDRDLRDRITTIHSNSSALDQQSRLLQRETQKMGKQVKTWSGMAEGARGGLKELGDVQNWAEMIEQDLALIEETLKIVHEGEEEGDGYEGYDRRY